MVVGLRLEGGEVGRGGVGLQAGPSSLKYSRTFLCKVPKTNDRTDRAGGEPGIVTVRNVLLL